MFKFIRMQYRLGKITKEQVRALVPQVLSISEAESIVGE